MGEFHQEIGVLGGFEASLIVKQHSAGGHWIDSVLHVDVCVDWALELHEKFEYAYALE
jgi:hypothetical protein